MHFDKLMSIKDIAYNEKIFQETALELSTHGELSGWGANTA